MRGIAAGVGWFAVFLLVHFLVFHVVLVRARIRWLVGLALLTSAAYAALYLWLPDDGAYLPAALAAPSDAATFANGVLLFLFLFMGYGQFLYMAESSVSVRTIVELLQAPGRRLTLEELNRCYPHRWMVERRLRRLVDVGYLTERSGVFRATPKGKAVAVLFGRLKVFLRLGRGG